MKRTPFKISSGTEFNRVTPHTGEGMAEALCKLADERVESEAFDKGLTAAIYELASDAWDQACGATNGYGRGERSRMAGRDAMRKAQKIRIDIEAETDVKS